MDTIGCGIEPYIELKVWFRVSLELPAAGGLTEDTGGTLSTTFAPPLPRLWLRSFSSRLHFARLLLNHTWKEKKGRWNMKTLQQNSENKLRTRKLPVRDYNLAKDT